MSWDGVQGVLELAVLGWWGQHHTQRTASGETRVGSERTKTCCPRLLGHSLAWVVLGAGLRVKKGA